MHQKHDSFSVSESLKSLPAFFTEFYQTTMTMDLGSGWTYVDTLDLYSSSGSLFMDYTLFLVS